MGEGPKYNVKGDQSKHVISLRDVYKAFGPNEVLRGVDLDV
jgi:ABC-type transporter Mla maintaining outer membrane lipid asymmetry ATPase subunit MlaF